MMTQDDAEIQPGGWYGRVMSAMRRPLTQALLAVAVIGLLALLYLNQVTSVAGANARLQALRAERTRLEQQNAQLHQQLGRLTSPAAVDQRARALGLAPDPSVPAVVLPMEGAFRQGAQR